MIGVEYSIKRLAMFSLTLGNRALESPVKYFFFKTLEIDTASVAGVTGAIKIAKSLFY